jgi:hypothetical protein
MHRIVFEMLTVDQLANKFLAFYEIRKIHRRVHNSPLLFHSAALSTVSLHATTVSLVVAPWRVAKIQRRCRGTYSFPHDGDKCP